MIRTITLWDVETVPFWDATGRKVAMRNLLISIPCLLLAFAVWMMWSIIVVQMQSLGFVFDPDPGKNTSLLYTLPAIAGLSGATLRIPNSFLVAVGGGRNVVFVTTALLLIPTAGVGIALQDVHTPYVVFAVLAALSGFGGGNFASSMSNITFFFPKRMQGSALGLNAGLGNLGVSLMQVLLPLTMGYALFGAVGGAGLAVRHVDGTVADTVLYIQNAGWTWVPLLIAVAVTAWFGMNNLTRATPELRSTATAIGKALLLVVYGLAAAGAGLLLLIGLGLNMWIVLPVTIVLTLLLIRYGSPGELKTNLSRQFGIFWAKHTWVMTVIYTMTFGSFIGYSAAFPKLIQDIFSVLPDGSVNPHAPNPFHYAWLGPLVGSVARPAGGWLSDKVKSGSKVTQWTTVVMILAALGAAWFIMQAQNSPTPERYFLPFLLTFLLLFITTGIGNGSTFRSIPYIFRPAQAGPVLGWTSAVAAYGAFIIPQVFGEQIGAGHPEYALYGFAVYYGLCLLLNWWFYVRRNSGIEC